MAENEESRLNDEAASAGEVSGKDDSQNEAPSRPSRRARRQQKKFSDIVHFDNRSFLALLVRSFTTFTLITVAATALIVLAALWANSNKRINVSVQSIADYETELKNNPSSPSVPLEVILGNGGWLDVVDAETAEKIYGSGGSREYTLGEINCVQPANGGEIRATNFKTPEGDFNYFISKSYQNGSESADEYLLLSSDLKVLSNTMPEFAGKTEFTQREFDLLVYNPVHRGEVVKKYYFESKDGRKCYAIYLDVNDGEATPPWLFMAIMIVGVVALFITAIGFYIRYINKHVQRPIQALNSAMDKFAKSGYRGRIEYMGSKDFEQLIGTFNEMVSLLNATEEQRNALEQDRQRMLAGLSHDLKTPITVIEGFSKAMRDGLVREEDKPKYLNLIISKAEHMGELINEFYEYSKLDHPDFRLNAQQTDVAETLRTYFAARYGEFEINGYDLDLDVPERIDAVLDKEQFIRVMDNIVGNFFKYTPKGSLLKVLAREDENGVRVLFEDNGGGIPEEARADIFEPFVVAEKSRNKQGTGLGLALCKKIIEAHGGRISLLPAQDGFNTIFEVLLPRAAE